MSRISSKNEILAIVVKIYKSVYIKLFLSNISLISLICSKYIFHEMNRGSLVDYLYRYFVKLFICIWESSIDLLLNRLLFLNKSSDTTRYNCIFENASSSCMCEVVSVTSYPVLRTIFNLYLILDK